MSFLDELFHRHGHTPDPASRVWLESIHHLANSILKMSTSADNLTAAVAANTQAVTDLTASIDAAVTDIGQGAAGDGQLDALTNAIAANTASLAAQKARLDAAVNPPAPAPAPVVPAPTA